LPAKEVYIFYKRALCLPSRTSFWDTALTRWLLRYMVSTLERSLTSQAKWLLRLLQKSPISPAKNPILTHVCSHKVIVEVHGQQIGKEPHIASKMTLISSTREPYISRQESDFDTRVLSQGDCWGTWSVHWKRALYREQKNPTSSTKEPHSFHQESSFETRVLSQGDCWVTWSANWKGASHRKQNDSYIFYKRALPLPPRMRFWHTCALTRWLLR